MGIKTELRNAKRKEVVEAIIVRKEPVYLVRKMYTYQKELFLIGYHSIGQAAGMPLVKLSKMVGQRK